MKNKVLLLSSITLAVIGLDQWSKYIVRTSPDLHHVSIIEGWLAMHYTQNPGMAMGIKVFPTLIVGLISTTAILIITTIILRQLKQSSTGQILCYGLIIGGAFGNIIDRMFMGIWEGYAGFMEGHVVDFIHFNLVVFDFPVFPYIFNVADVAISCAVITMLIFHKTLLPFEPKTAPQPSDASQN